MAQVLNDLVLAGAGGKQEGRTLPIGKTHAEGGQDTVRGRHTACPLTPTV
jgi:hypothetical protein